MQDYSDHFHVVVRYAQRTQGIDLVLFFNDMDVLWRETTVRPLAVDEVADVASWRYRGDWSVYDLSTPQPLLDNLSSFYAVIARKADVAFYCTGKEARIAGMGEDPAILDVGLGMNPKLVGRGNGA